MADPGSPRLPADLDRLVHDLRGPLNAATMHLEILKRAAPGDPVAKQSLETLGEALARLATLLPAAFTIAALERGPAARVGLRALAERAVTEAGGDVTLAPGAWPDVVGDEALLARAVGQLVANAVAATREGAAARGPEIAATATGDTVTLIVRDWGPPLPSMNAKVLIRLVAPATPAHRGTGLLAVERIARLHGGTLGFENTSNGTELRLTLPAAR